MKMNYLKKPSIYTFPLVSSNNSAQCDCGFDQIEYSRSKNLIIQKNCYYKAMYLNKLLINSQKKIINLDNEHFILYNSYYQSIMVNKSVLLFLSLLNPALKTNPENLINIIVNEWGKQLFYSTVDKLIKIKAIEIKGDKQSDQNRINQTLSVWLHITDRCNLNCSYCYVSQNNNVISLDTGKKAIKSILDSALKYNYSKVRIKYAGGEPSYYLNIITKLHQHAKKLFTKHNIYLEGVVLTNGTLWNINMIDTLKKNDLKIIISLDGINNFHNVHRKYKNGSGSYINVNKTINLLLKNDIKPNISITITNENVDGLPELLNYLLNEKLYFSLNIYRNILPPKCKISCDEKKIISGMLNSYEVIKSNLPNFSLLSSLLDNINISRPHLHSCGVGHSYIVFDTQGYISECQMNMKHKISKISDIDPISILRNNSNNIQNISIDEKEECSDCIYRYWCTGGCPLQTYIASGCFHKKSPNCNIYKALIPEVLKLEGLRMLLYNKSE